MNLRPCTSLHPPQKKIEWNDDEWTFSRSPIILKQDLSYTSEVWEEETDYGSDTDDMSYYMDYPWYHRARLGDEPNKVYIDYEWDNEWQYFEEKAEAVEYQEDCEKDFEDTPDPYFY